MQLKGNESVGAEPATGQDLLNQISLISLSNNDEEPHPEIVFEIIPVDADDVASSEAADLPRHESSGLDAKLSDPEDANKNETTGEGTSLELIAGPRDPQADNLQKDASALYDEANKAYRETEGHVDEYIRINNSLRSTIVQASLYEKYYKYLYYNGPYANAANQPGKSYHEYGLAIDIIRDNDESRLAKALEDHGWQRINADEGWHFEARSLDAFEKTTDAIAIRVQPLLSRYISELDSHCRKQKQYDADWPTLLTEQNRLRLEENTIRSQEQALRHVSQELNSRQSQLRNSDNALRSELATINNLTAQYNSMVYNLCPNGNSFETCDHENLKRDWLGRKQDLYNTLMYRRSRYNDNLSSYQRAKKQFDDDFQKFRTDKAAYEQRRQKFLRERASANQTKARLTVLITQARQHKLNAGDRVRTIASIVNGIRRG